MRSIDRYVVWEMLTFSVLISLHFKMFSIPGFGVSPSLVLIPVWFYRTFKVNRFEYSDVEKIALFTMVLIPFLPMGIISWSDFFQTYFQYVLAYFFVIRAYKKLLLIPLSVVNRVLRHFQILLVITVSFQFLLVAILNLDEFYNLFGENQLYYQLRYELANGRMKAFYLEPSYLGFVTTSIFWTRLYINKQRRIISTNTLLTIIVLALCSSSTAFIVFIVIIVFEIFKSVSYNAVLKHGFLYLSGVIVVAYLFFDKLYSALRLTELYTTGEGEIVSGFTRVTLPLSILKKIWDDGYYFGLTFGQLDSYAFKIMTNYGEQGISNSFILLLCYFGIFGLLMFAALFFVFIKSKNTVLTSFIILMVLNLNNSGAFVTSQFVMISFLIPFIALSNEFFYVRFRKTTKSELKPV